MNLRRFIATAGAVLALYGFSAGASAKNPKTQAELVVPKVEAVKIEKGPKIDGSLDDLVWQQAAVVDGFKQTNPNEGDAVSEKTEVKVLYDEHNIYFGFENFDSEPSKIIRRVTQRDTASSSDKVSVLLSTFNDKRNAYIFTLTAGGVQTDAFLGSSGGGGEDYHEIGDTSWDAVWSSGVKVNDKGWFAEIAIPLKILKVSSQQEQSWGINFLRSISRKNESASWASFERDFGFRRIDRAGELVGIKDIKSGKGLEILPYAMASSEKLVSNGQRQSFFDKNAGLDLKYSPVSNMMLDATVNPDFGQIESDLERIDVTRYEKFFPEKRPFFLEGASTFSMPVQMFYSRRIGRKLPDGSVAPILTGFKMTGKTNGFELGFIDALTGARQYSFFGDATEPFTNYGVLRVKKDVLDRSSLGLMLTTKDFQGNGAYSYSRALGIDGNFSFSKYYSAGFMVAKSFNPGIKGDDYLFVGGVGRNTDLWNVNLSGGLLGKNFTINEMGYMERNDLMGGEFSASINPRPEKFGIRQIYLGPRASAYYDTSGVFQLSQLRNSLFTIFDFPEKLWHLGYWVMDLNYSIAKEYYEDVINGSNNWRTYNYKTLSAEIMTDSSKMISLGIEGSTGDFLDYYDKYLGKNNNLEFMITANPRSNLSLSLSLNNSYEYYGSGELDEVKRLIVGRVNYAITKDLFIKVLAQKVMNGEQGHSINALLEYDLNAKSRLFLVYNSTKNSSLQLDDNVVFLKFSYLFDF
ncbi:MAG TPA: DUF5916 domain-containing protein [Candidatus Nanoarchaeia archaeon]|nr:DUF5916 domain-containing protein [Candidatus Nanoarchaeia archaeon]